MKRAVKKIAALLLTAAMLVSTACGYSSAVAMTIDGVDINAGEYIFAQFKANNNGIEKFKELNPDVDTTAEGFDFYAQTLEGKSFSDWVIDDSVDMLAKRRVYEKKFDEMGLSFTPDEISERNSTVNSTWNNENSELAYYGIEQKTLGLYYESLGISKASYQKMTEADAKAEKVFHAIYDEGGTKPISEDEIKAEFARAYFRFKLISIPTTDSEGNNITDEAELKELEDMAAGYVERLKAGDSFASVIRDFEAYNDTKNAEGTDEATDEAEEITDEVTDEPLEDDLADDYIDEESYDYRVSLSEVESYAENESSDYQLYKRVSEMPFNEAEYMKGDYGYYVFVRLDINEREDWLDGLRDEIQHLLKGDEIDSEVAELAKQVTVVRNEAAIKRYNPKKTL